VATEVVAPDGARWRVRRRWLGGRSLPRWRGMSGGDLGDSLLEVVGAGGDNILGAIAFALAALVALLVFFVLPLAILLVELPSVVVIGPRRRARSILRPGSSGLTVADPAARGGST
jgi:hypothetical protein